ncbi:portal protein [Desulfovibrio piger]|uniref:portal protein n=1 Tax=Desulfovibrio piger TaxID=901 RepID=UPI0026EB261C|nr:portal protein [Desulfovibrio piger]
MKTGSQYPQEAASPSKAGRALTAIYPGWGMVEERESLMVGLPASASAYFSGGIRGGVDTNHDGGILGSATSSDAAQITHVLPEDRSARYAVLRLMAKDPTIDSAIKMHIANALSARTDSGESVFISPAEGAGQDKIVDDLRATLMPFIKKDLNEWARKAAVYGSCFARVYGAQGIGIQNIRCDYYTHPRFIQKFEKGGRLAGYTTTYQGTNQANQRLRLMPPWSFVDFEIPEWWDCEDVEPINVGGIPVDLAMEDAAMEGLVESQEYGTSLIATAYGPWMDLLDAICSLKMSRRNAARLERMVGVNTGKLDPERAAHYLDMVAERISNATADVERQSWLRGNVQTVVNHYVPIFGEKGGLQIDAVQGTPDINGLEDVMFHIKRLGSAIGVDPALLGFGDLLSGGLGDGGFFRVSVMAATKANLLRQALKNGIQKLCELHVAYKFGKVFLPGNYPWTIQFNSVSSAIEREEQEALESRTNALSGLVGILATIDQDFQTLDKRELFKEIFLKLHFSEDSFEAICPEGKNSDPTPPEDEEEE